MSAYLVTFRVCHLLEDVQQDINIRGVQNTMAAIKTKNLFQKVPGVMRRPRHDRALEI